jgi:uncharacterized cupin superfamily protein
MARFHVRKLEDVPVVPDPGPCEPDWKPLRHYLGLSAFGVNAFVARAPGDRLVVDHTELPGDGAGHEELYLVLAGEADFTLDGETFAAVAGTIVAVPDLSVRRTAVARSAGTTVLVVGAPRGHVFTPSEWDRRWTEHLPRA